MRHRVTLIPGEGIGPEVTQVARRAIDATGVEIDWDVQQAGASVLADEGTLMPPRVVDAIARSGVALKGPLTTRTGHPSPNVALRRELDLFASVRPVRGLTADRRELEVVTFKMNLEDLSAGIGFAADDPTAAAIRELVRAARGVELPTDTGLSLKPLSRTQAARAHEAAFAYAERRGRRRVTAVHKGTIQHATDAMFVAVGREVAAGHPAVEYDDRLVDAVCHDLARKPGGYDVLVAPSLYGDIVSDLAAGLTGGLGLAPAANLGDRVAVFEAVHGTAERLAGRDVANPLALVGAGTMLLHHIGESTAADRLESAVAELQAADTPLTYDVDRSGSPAGTAAVGDALVRLLADGQPA